MKFRLINETKVTPDLYGTKPAGTKDVCAGGLLVKKNKFLFGKRSKTKKWAPGVWDIVGGNSLKDEHPMFTLKRETFEETGAEVMNAELLTTADVANELDGKPLFRYHIYLVTHFKGKVFNKTREHTKLKWFTRSELDSLPLALEEYIALIDQWIGRPRR